MIAIAYASQGSKHNLNLLSEGKIDSALVQSNELQTMPTNIKVITALFPEYLHAVVNGHSPLQRFSDLKNKNISMGSVLSGSTDLVKPILETLGLNRQEYASTSQELSQSCDALVENQIDALLYFGGGPIPSINSLARCQQIKLLGLTRQQQLKLTSKYKYLVPIEIPAGMYWGVAKTTTVAVHALWVTRADMPNERVTELMKSLYHPKAQKYLNDAYPSLHLLSKEEAKKIASKYLHSGSLHTDKESPK